MDDQLERWRHSSLWEIIYTRLPCTHTSTVGLGRAVRVLSNELEHSPEWLGGAKRPLAATSLWEMRWRPFFFNFQNEQGGKTLSSRMPNVIGHLRWHLHRRHNKSIDILWPITIAMCQVLLLQRIQIESPKKIAPRKGVQLFFVEGRPEGNAATVLSENNDDATWIKIWKKGFITIARKKKGLSNSTGGCIQFIYIYIHTHGP